MSKEQKPKEEKKVPTAQETLDWYNNELKVLRKRHEYSKLQCESIEYEVRRVRALGEMAHMQEQMMKMQAEDSEEETSTEDTPSEKPTKTRTLKKE